MSGTLQLFIHLAVAGITLGFGIAVFRDAGAVRLVFASLFWLVACFHFAETFWIASWARGRDLGGRVGIAITGAGFALISVMAVLPTITLSIAAGFLGILVVFFGRIAWELTLANRSSS